MINIKVFIPSFKRLQSLPAVLYSLVKTVPTKLESSKTCYVVNNFPENEEQLIELILTFNEKKTGWEFTLINRKETIPPIKNWYGAINDYADEGDIVFLQGDDDLFLPQGIAFRVDKILEKRADLLITNHAGGILFFDDSEKISIKDFKLNADPYTETFIDWKNFTWSPIFIGNNTYRFSPLLKAAFNKAMEWCDEQDWLNFDQRTLMYPLYIPLSLLTLGGAVFYSNKECVIRGVNLDEIMRAWWNVPGWNSGFLHWAFMGILRNSDLGHIKDLDHVRESANNYVSLWYFTFFIDPKISPTTRKLTQIRIGKPNIKFKNYIKSFMFLTKGLLGRIEIYNKVKGMVKNHQPSEKYQLFIDGLYHS